MKNEKETKTAAIENFCKNLRQYMLARYKDLGDNIESDFKDFAIDCAEMYFVAGEVELEIKRDLERQIARADVERKEHE